MWCFCIVCILLSVPQVRSNRSDSILKIVVSPMLVLRGDDVKALYYIHFIPLPAAFALYHCRLLWPDVGYLLYTMNISQGVRWTQLAYVRSHSPSAIARCRRILMSSPRV